MKLLKNTIILLSLLLFANCATIVHGPIQEINFSSQPKGAKISIDGKDFGVTPKVISLRREGRNKEEDKNKKEYNVVIELEGYQTYETKITRKADKWVIGNLVFGGIIGIIVDYSTGALYQLTPEQIDAKFENQTVFTNDKNIYIAVTLEVDPNWKKIGQLEK